MNNPNDGAETIVSKELFTLFQRWAGREMYFIEPGGNFGDHIIYKGAYKLARLAKLQYKVLTFAEFEQKKFDSQDILYIHGGGGFVPWWSGKPMKMLKRLSNEFQGILILGPTTFSEDHEYIRTVFNDCIGQHSFKELFIFTRERLSFEILKKYLPSRADIFLDHDTAINLVKTDLVQRDYPAKHTIYAIRHDKERPQSQRYNYFSWLDPIDASTSFDEWVRFHIQAKKLITNRTHSTILGTILGVPTIMLPNSYHKNRSIWEFSLKQRGVEWLDHVDCGKIHSFIEGNNLLRRCFTSRSYRKLLKFRLNQFGF